MQREYIRWFSSSLNMEMESLVFGYFGTPILVIPTSRGRFYDWEDFGMIESLRWAIDGGLIKLYCVDSVDSYSWFARTSLVEERMRWHQQYEHYIVSEVHPFIEKHCNTPNIPIILSGVSFGAFHAMSMFLRNPKIFSHALCMSGVYHIQDMIEKGGEVPEYQAYDPSYIIHHLLSDEQKSILASKIGPIIYCGQGAYEREMVVSSKKISAEMTDLNFPHIFNLWGNDVDHHWYWWQRQFDDFLKNAFPGLITKP